MHLQALRPRRRQQFTKFYRFKNLKLLDETGQGEEALGDGEPGPLAAARRHGAALLRVREQGPGLRRRHATKYVPIGDRVEVNVGPDTGHHDPPAAEGPEDRQRRCPAVQAAAGRRVRDVLRPDRLRRDVLLSRRRSSRASRSVAKMEIERRFDANVVLWGRRTSRRKDWNAQRAGRLRRPARRRRPRGAGRPEPRQVLPRPEAGREANWSATA